MPKCKGCGKEFTWQYDDGEGTKYDEADLAELFKQIAPEYCDDCLLSKMPRRAKDEKRYYVPPYSVSI